jgi:hypothetical protein
MPGPTIEERRGLLQGRASFSLWGEPAELHRVIVTPDDTIYISVPWGWRAVTELSSRVSNRIRREVRRDAWTRGVFFPWILVTADPSNRVNVARIDASAPPRVIANTPCQRLLARADGVNAGTTAKCGLARVLLEFGREWPDAIVIARSPKVRAMVAKCLTANLERNPDGSGQAF